MLISHRSSDLLIYWGQNKMGNVYKKDYPMPIIREWKEHRIHQRKQCEMNKLRMNTSEMPRCIVEAFCCFTTLSSYPLVQLSKISNTPSELFQSVQRPTWPQANSKPLLTFKALPLFLCMSERNRRNAIGNLDQGMDIIKISFSEVVFIQLYVLFDCRACELLF